MPKPPPGYEIRCLLGDGANGLVYLAREVDQDREVALKEFRIGPDSAQRFFRELSLLFTLDHPHLVRCLNFVHSAEGSNFLVLEFASGGSLRRRLARQGMLSLEETAALARQMAGALECAHRHNVIHCDVKPENILLASEDGPIHYKLTDLGIAYHRLRDPVPQLGGSPRYMAPEQFYDRPLPASDFYSLGIVLFECLLGEAPFVGSNEYLFNAHTREVPDLEGVKDTAWRRLLGQMLEKDPGRRPVSWKAMESILEGGARKVRESVSIPAEEKGEKASAGMKSFWGGALVAVGKAVRVLGARDLWLPFGSRENRVWVADERSVDWWEMATGKLRPKEVIGRFQVGATPVEGDACAAVLSDMLHVFSETGRKPEVHPVPLRLCSLMQLADGGFWSADGRRVFYLNETGRVMWAAPCASYVFPTILAASREGEVVAARGPALPALMRWSRDGSLQGMLEVMQPVMAAGFAEDGVVRCVVQGSQADQPCGLWVWGRGGLEKVADLEEGAFAARWMGDAFVLFTTGGEMVVIDLEGREQGRVELPGSPLQVVWVPGCSSLVTLSKTTGGGLLQRFQFQCKAGELTRKGADHVHYI